MKRGAERRPVSGHPAPFAAATSAHLQGNMMDLKIATNVHLDRGSVRVLHAAGAPLVRTPLNADADVPASSSILGRAQAKMQLHRLFFHDTHHHWTTLLRPSNESQFSCHPTRCLLQGPIPRILSFSRHLLQKAISNGPRPTTDGTSSKKGSRPTDSHHRG